MRETDDASKLIPLVLTERQLFATFAAVRSVFGSGAIMARTPEERELVKPLAGAMVRLAEAVDKARSPSPSPSVAKEV